MQYLDRLRGPELWLAAWNPWRFLQTWLIWKDTWGGFNLFPPPVAESQVLLVLMQTREMAEVSVTPKVSHAVESLLGVPHVSALMRQTKRRLSVLHLIIVIMRQEKESPGYLRAMTSFILGTSKKRMTTVLWFTLCKRGREKKSTSWTIKLNISRMYEK